jgi:His-Xaa-Ser system protein HxsD
MRNMSVFRLKKELYSKIALIKAAYNFTDKAYIHLDADKDYYIVTLKFKEGCNIKEDEFVNEMLAQSVRHEVYIQTKNIRELILARALASSVVLEDENSYSEDIEENKFVEDEILKDWFESND